MGDLDPDAIERTVTIARLRCKTALVPTSWGASCWPSSCPLLQRKRPYIARQLTTETWESELRLECPHKRYVDLSPIWQYSRAKMYAELHGGKV